MRRSLEHAIQTCNRKTPFTKLKFANQAAGRMTQKHPRDCFEVYQCRMCGCWHVGRPYKRKGNE